jgi:uncharacterized protein YndB with AHSA1/START domain
MTTKNKSNKKQQTTKSEPLVLERTFNAPIARVWKAITNKDDMKEWSFDIKEFKPEAGFEFEFYGEKDGVKYFHRCKIAEVIPEKKLAYSWRYEGHEGNSMVTFELFAEGNKTRLRLTHEGLETFPQTPAFAKSNFVEGWTALIGENLKLFVETPPNAADREFVITRIFDAPRELVWKSWTDPKKVAQWWGPHNFTTPVCEMDVRPGGAYRFVMRGPDGSEFPLKGVYLEIVEPERLVTTNDHSELPPEWHDSVNPNRDKTKKPGLEAIQTVTFEKLGNKTKLTIRTRFESAAIRDAMVKHGMNEGWSQSLERLAKCVAPLS